MLPPHPLLPCKGSRPPPPSTPLVISVTDPPPSLPSTQINGPLATTFQTSPKVQCIRSSVGTGRGCYGTNDLSHFKLSNMASRQTRKHNNLLSQLEIDMSEALIFAATFCWLKIPVDESRSRPDPCQLYTPRPQGSHQGIRQPSPHPSPPPTRGLGV